MVDDAALAARIERTVLFPFKLLVRVPYLRISVSAHLFGARIGSDVALVIVFFQKTVVRNQKWRRHKKLEFFWIFLAISSR